MSNQGFRLVKRTDYGHGRFVAIRAQVGNRELWSRRLKHQLVLDQQTAEDAADTWNDYAATKGYSWRVVAEKA